MRPLEPPFAKCVRLVQPLGAFAVVQEPLLVGIAGYLDAALVEAGRPGWTRFLQPGDPVPRRGVSGIDRTG